MELHRITAFILLKCLKDNQKKFSTIKETQNKYLKNVLYVILTSCPAFGLSQAIHIIMSDVICKDITNKLISKAASGKYC